MERINELPSLPESESGGLATVVLWQGFLFRKFKVRDLTLFV